MNTEFENNNVLCIFVNCLGADVTYWIHIKYSYQCLFLFNFIFVHILKRQIWKYQQIFFSNIFSDQNYQSINNFEQKICELIIENNKSRLRFWFKHSAYTSITIVGSIIWDMLTSDRPTDQLMNGECFSMNVQCIFFKLNIAHRVMS